MSTIMAEETNENWFPEASTSKLLATRCKAAEMDWSMESRRTQRSDTLNDRLEDTDLHLSTLENCERPMLFSQDISEYINGNPRSANSEHYFDDLDSSYHHISGTLERVFRKINRSGPFPITLKTCNSVISIEEGKEEEEDITDINKSSSVYLTSSRLLQSMRPPLGPNADEGEPERFRLVPGFVLLARRVDPALFAKFVYFFFSRRRWPRFASLPRSFRAVCRRLGVSRHRYKDIPPFAPEWLFHLRKMDLSFFWTVLRHVFLHGKFPSWDVFPPAYVAWFRALGLGEFDYPSLGAPPLRGTEAGAEAEAEAEAEEGGGGSLAAACAAARQRAERDQRLQLTQGHFTDALRERRAPGTREVVQLFLRRPSPAPA